MKLFTPKFKYALQIASMLNPQGKRVSVKTIIGAGIPRSYVIKIMDEFSKNKSVKAKEGRGGGYVWTGKRMFVINPEETAIIDLLTEAKK